MLLRSGQRPEKPVLARNTLYTVRRVDVLDERDLVAGRRALAGDDGRVGQEVLPNLLHTSHQRPVVKAYLK